tara:strand:- start:1016 stop:2527 length:1512 start_codon:yes stop_codon:yes gene_type:complete
MAELEYKPSGVTAKNFMLSNKFVRGLRGPVGSGKSVACCIEIFRRAAEQEPGKDGIRRTKWAVIRNTNPELRTTTIATWLQWFPEDQWGNFRWSPPFTHKIRKGDIDLEVLFLPLDTPDDVKKLLSLELTGVWINEAREVPKAIVDGATSRVGRFPSKKDGASPTWNGVIMDTNAPDEEHWWSIMSGAAPVPDHISADDALMLVKPDNWEFFEQPGGMIDKRDDKNNLVGYEINDKGENLDNLPPEYYPNMIQGKTRSWISVYVLNRLGSLEEGKPVYEGFSEKTHVLETPMDPGPMPVYIGIDFGLTPAAAFLQKLPNGRWFCLAELVCTDMGAVRFAEVLNRFIAEEYPDQELHIFGDPSGDFRAPTDETTPFQILHANGIMARPAPSNDPIIRVEAVNGLLSRMVDGQSGFLIDKKKCPSLVNGFIGGYHYRRLRVTGERYEEKPEKNKFSHIHDALQYAVLGGGEGRAIVRGKRQTNSFVAKHTWNPFGKKRRGVASRF